MTSLSADNFLGRECQVFPPQENNDSTTLLSAGRAKTTGRFWRSKHFARNVPVTFCPLRLLIKHIFTSRPCHLDYNSSQEKQGNTTTTRSGKAQAPSQHRRNSSAVQPRGTGRLHQHSPQVSPPAPQAAVRARRDGRAARGADGSPAG